MYNDCSNETTCKIFESDNETYTLKYQYIPEYDGLVWSVKNKIVGALFSVLSTLIMSFIFIVLLPNDTAWIWILLLFLPY